MSRVALLLLALLTLPTASGCRLLAPKPRDYMERTLPSGVVVQTIVIPIQGDNPYARGGDRLTLHYTAYLDDGTRVDSSLDTGMPVECELGDGSLPTGLEHGLYGLRLGAERRIVVPPELAYGAEGVEGLVPPDSRITFIVELIDLQRAPDPGAAGAGQ